MGTIRLVPFGEEHDAAFTAMLADAEIARFTPLPQPVPPGFAATWRRRYDDHRPHRENFAVVDDEGCFLGIAVAPMVDREARTAELGYAVVPEARGHGIALEALRQLTAWAVEQGMQRIFLLISVENTASKRVARRAGYRFEGVLRARYVKPGVRQDTESWSFLPPTTADAMLVPMSHDRPTVGVTDRDALADAIEAEGLALARLLHVSAPGHASTRVPGLDWTVAETAAHVLGVVRRALGDRRRSATPAETATLNALALRAIDLRDPVTLGMEIDRDTEVVARRVLAQVRNGDALIPFHAGTHVRTLDAFGALLAELVVHGHDIARALGVRHATPPAHAAMGLRAFLAVMPGWLDPERAGAERSFRLDVGDLPAVARATVSGGVLAVAWSPDLERDTEPLDPLSSLLALTHRVTSVDADLAGLADVLLPM